MGAMIPVLRCKKGVEFKTIAPAGFRILAALDGATKVLGSDLEITAGTNDHTTGKHPIGMAYDISVRYLTVPMILRLVSYLKQVLGERFGVLYETPDMPIDPDLQKIAYVNKQATGNHLHIQLRKGINVYPPPELQAHV